MVKPVEILRYASDLHLEMKSSIIRPKCKSVEILRYASDLHLEMKSSIIRPKLLPLWNFNRSEDDVYYLALLGDIGNPFHPNLKLFLEKVSAVYKKIYYVPGNHEYYNFNVNPNKSILQFKQKLLDIIEKFPNIILLDNKTDNLDEIKIIGSTLWSNVPSVDAAYIGEAINDYHLIKKEDSNGNLTKITVNDTNTWNSEAIEFISKEISSTNNSCIVLTHHAPLFSDEDNNRYTADPKYLYGENNSAFHNDLQQLIKPPVLAWLYGHTHYASSFKLNNVIIATNQLGYNNEENNIKFNPYAYIDLKKISVDSL
jgi:predicted phosphodiesterase